MIQSLDTIVKFSCVFYFAGKALGKDHPVNCKYWRHAENPIVAVECPDVAGFSFKNPATMGIGLLTKVLNNEDKIKMVL